MDTSDSPALDPHDAETVVAGMPGSADKPTDEIKVSDDGNQITRGEKKYVREEALHEERQARQRLSKTLEQIEPLWDEFNEYLTAKRDRGVAGREAAAPAAGDVGDDDYSEEELRGLAVVRGFYDDKNQPDLRRAKQELTIMSRIADRRAGKIVQPVASATIRDRATANQVAARARTFVDGELVADPKYIDAAFEALPEQYRADPEIAKITTVIAAGLQALDDRKNGKSGRTARREPAFREGSSGRLGSHEEATLDALDRAAARSRGKSPDQWAKMQKSLSGGSQGGTVLEEV